MSAMEALRALQADAIAADGVPPFNDQALVEAERGERELLMLDGAIALATADGSEVEFAVPAAFRGAGRGAAVVAALRERFPDGFEAWSHGDFSAARALAARNGARRVRTLLQLRAPVPESSPAGAVRTFRDGDQDAWLALNAAAFADHPEQGSLTLEDLESRRAQAWHNDANLLVHEGERGMDAYAWVKPGEEVAELYAIGVDPAAQGSGLGRHMLHAALWRMQQLGAALAHLYVEGENAGAIALYRSAGFTDYAIDVRWRIDEFTSALPATVRMET